jgi:hypothetical protein
MIDTSRAAGECHEHDSGKRHFSADKIRWLLVAAFCWLLAAKLWAPSSRAGVVMYAAICAESTITLMLCCDRYRVIGALGTIAFCACSCAYHVLALLGVTEPRACGCLGAAGALLGAHRLEILVSSLMGLLAVRFWQMERRLEATGRGRLWDM